jgi:hypothetical protein
VNRGSRSDASVLLIELHPWFPRQQSPAKSVNAPGLPSSINVFASTAS